MHNKYPHIFTPLRIKNTVFKNRITAAPITANRICIDGAPTPEGIDAYENKARGGFSQVTLTESFIDFEYAARHEHGINIISKDMSTYHIEAIRTLVEGIKAHGAVASIQLNHVGGVNHPSTCIDGNNPIGPSHIIRDDGVTIDEMTIDDMERVSEHYADACAAAKSFGFDMVMLHGGHGWLLSQFISPLSNQRSDEYGGSLENRSRFPLMVLKRIREKVGEDFLLEYRVSGDERIQGGMEIRETVEFCKIIEPYIDIIHVTAGIYHSHVETKAFSSMFDEHGCNLSLAEAIKRAVNIPVVAVGGFNHPSQIEEALKQKKCDFVALGRQQFADVDFVNKALFNEDDEIAPCIRCSCFNPLAPDPEKRIVPDLWECTVNPLSGRELRMRNAPQPKKSRKVLIVGGGVGGMYAAITASDRGHKVILCEKEDELGGVVRFAKNDIHKGDIEAFRQCLIARIMNRDIDVYLNKEITPEYLAKTDADRVIVAIGGTPIIPPIEGIDNAYYATDVYYKKDIIGENIAIIGGGLVGCEIALHLSGLNKNVTIFEKRHDLALEGNDSHRRALLPRIHDNVQKKCNVEVTKITTEGIYYMDQENKQHFLKSDTVLYSVGISGNPATIESFRKVCPHLVAIGDSLGGRLILNATKEGFFAAMDII